MKREKLTENRFVTVHTFSTLYAMSSKSKIKQWSVEVVKNDDGEVFTRKRHGYLNQKIQIQDKLVPCGKNIGKSNETTVIEQAIFNAQFLFNGKRDQNYTEKIPDENTVVENLLPMLAQKYQNAKHKLKFPCYIQPKMNGVRCLASVKDAGVDYTSKTGKSWLYFQHLTSSIYELRAKNYVLDGEIFHPDMHFQDITSYVKKYYPETEKLQFWIYDAITPDSNVSFKERWNFINSSIPDNHSFLVKVPTYLVNNEDEIEAYYKKILDRGFEGAILRNMDGVYRKGYRSADLQKYKPVEDAEFKIVGGHEASGTMKGCCVFECVTKDGAVFSVMPRGTRERRQEYWVNLQGCIGKMLTVEYEALSKEGRPLKPIGIVVRDYE